jgi:hypothetical protein
MDGPVVFHAAWMFTVLCVWFYQRFFQKVGPDSPELDALCRTRPLLAAFATKPGSEQVLAAELLALVGRRRELVPTLAGFPWTYHALSVDVTWSSGAVLVIVTGCRVLRTRDLSLPRCTDVLLDFFERRRDVIRESWLRPEVYVDVTGVTKAPRGWRLVPGNGRKQPCEPRDEELDWALAA